MTPDLDRALEAYAQAFQRFRNAGHGERLRAFKSLQKANLQVLQADIELRKSNKKSFEERRYGEGN